MIITKNIFILKNINTEFLYKDVIIIETKVVESCINMIHNNADNSKNINMSTYPDITKENIISSHDAIYYIYFGSRILKGLNEENKSIELYKNEKHMMSFNDISYIFRDIEKDIENKKNIETEIKKHIGRDYYKIKKYISYISENMKKDKKYTIYLDRYIYSGKDNIYIISLDENKSSNNKFVICQESKIFDVIKKHRNVKILCTNNVIINKNEYQNVINTNNK